MCESYDEKLAKHRKEGKPRPCRPRSLEQGVHGVMLHTAEIPRTLGIRSDQDCMVRVGTSGSYYIRFSGMKSTVTGLVGRRDRRYVDFHRDGGLVCHPEAE